LLIERARILNLARQLPAIDAAIRALENDRKSQSRQGGSKMPLAFFTDTDGRKHKNLRIKRGRNGTWHLIDAYHNTIIIESAPDTDILKTYRAECERAERDSEKDLQK